MKNFLRITDEGVTVNKGRYKGEELSEVAYEDPVFLKSILENNEELSSDEREEIETVLKNEGII